MQLSDFSVQFPVYQGPLDALLSMIESRKLSINDVSLATVADEFVQFVSQLPQYNHRLVVQFIALASTLILIKARSLLPDIPLTDEESQDADQLSARLRQYELVRIQARTIERLWMSVPLFTRPGTLHTVSAFCPHRGITPESLLSALHEVITSHTVEQSQLPQTPDIPEVSVLLSISLQDVIGRIQSCIQQGVRMSFRDMVPTDGTTDRVRRVYTVVAFLGLLELIRGGSVEASQDQLFQDITVSSVSM